MAPRGEPPSPWGNPKSTSPGENPTNSASSSAVIFPAESSSHPSSELSCSDSLDASWVSSDEQSSSSSSSSDEELLLSSTSDEESLSSSFSEVSSSSSSFRIDDSDEEDLERVLPCFRSSPWSPTFEPPGEREDIVKASSGKGEKEVVVSASSSLMLRSLIVV